MLVYLCTVWEDNIAFYEKEVDFINSIFPHVGMLLLCGGLVNGPYALITTAVSADLVRPEAS